MRYFLSGLVALCVFAGLNVRVLAAESGHTGNCAPATEVCCGDVHDEAPDDHQHDEKKCPEGHHHHGCCTPVQPLTMENDHLRQPRLFGNSLSGSRPEGDVLPEGPFLGSEKPPLI